MPQAEVIEDLKKFIDDQYQDPIVLCGEQREEKNQVMESLAYRAAKEICSRYKLVLFLKENHRRSCCHQVTLCKSTKKAVQEFKEQIFACLENLVPSTVQKYGLDAVKAVVETNQRDILFLVNWNYRVVGLVQSEMQQGTWVITCGAEPPQGSWQVLRLKPYTVEQVEKMLSHVDNQGNLLRCFQNFDSKDIFSSLDMIMMFCELKENIFTGNDFEFVEKYVSRKMQFSGSDMQQGKLDKLAFDSLCSKKTFFSEVHVTGIQEWLRDSFLSHKEGKGWSFKHSVVRDLLAAQYVDSNSSVACKNWVKKADNITAFKRVFKFACCMWFQSTVSKEHLSHMKAFLRELWHIPGTEKAKTHKDGEKRTGDKKSNPITRNEVLDDNSKHKHPFDDWDFLLELDEACGGRREVLECIVSILSEHRCWKFNCSSDCLNSGKLIRLEKVLKNICLNQRDPVIIKLKSSSDVSLLTELWKKFRGLKSMYNCVNIMVAIEGDESSHLSYSSRLANFLKRIADTQVPLYISRYRGPVFSSCTPSFLKCMCMRHLSLLEVSVYDVKSLCEMMACGALTSLKELFITVHLESIEQTSFKPESIEFPSEVSIYINFRYFPNIQQLLNSFKCCDRLCSLSIHELYVCNDFKLDLTKFGHLESLNIRFKAGCLNDNSHTLSKERMEVDVMEEHRMEVDHGTDTLLPRCSWLMPFFQGLSLPHNLERLLLRNTDFFNDSNHNFVEEFFKKYRINRLLILDSQLSLLGVGKILHFQTEIKGEVNHGGGKRCKRSESHDIKTLAKMCSDKRSRLSKEKREDLKWKKPSGKEVIITSDLQLCGDCSCFPCMCSHKVDRDGAEGSNTYENMVELINDMYHCRVQSFSYSFRQCTIRKDMCGDLRVECIMRCLNDHGASQIKSRSNLERFFLPLILAQSVTIKETQLSPTGVEKVAQYLGKIRGNNIEPFSLIIESFWHPLESGFPFSEFKYFLKAAEYLSVVHFRCNCTPRCTPTCFHVKKTHEGKIEDL